MDTIAGRIIELVKYLGIKRVDFARSLNLTPAYITKLDKQRGQVPSVRTIADICRVYNVNEGWLRTGEGEMFLQEPKALLDALDCEDSLTQKDKAMLAGFLCLSPKDREGVANYVLKAAGLFKGDRVRVPLTAADQAAALDREESEAVERVRAEFARRRAKL